MGWRGSDLGQLCARQMCCVLDSPAPGSFSFALRPFHTARKPSAPSLMDFELSVAVEFRNLSLWTSISAPQAARPPKAPNQ